MKDQDPEKWPSDDSEFLMRILKEILAALHEWRHMAMPLFFDSADVKRMLKISDRTLCRLRREKHIPCTKIGRKYYYPSKFFLEAFF
ncbi:helix-turn-helix domain-containing protein [Weeksellaceae bacterium A-14]|uniref:helix-turn-helix domain-containing protein n=1 Tax=Daejeonia sp. YH14 TaxID=3439042 RepID=UPI0031E4B653